MKKKNYLLRLAVLVTAMMCALGAAAAEAYANYTPSNTTLTFYYDNLRSSRTGTTYDLNTGNYSPGWRDDGTYSNVSEVKFDPSFTNARPTTCHSWFRDMAQLQTIYGLNYMNTSAVTHMVSMFRGCSSLTVLDLTSFNTANVIAMGGMFMGCSNLRTIYAGSGWSTAAVEASAGMFSSCTSLVGGQGTTFNSSHVGIDYAHIDGGPSNPGYFSEKGPEAYACYTPSNTTLTFYYDTQRSSRSGTTYDLNEGYNYPDWYNDGTNASVTKVVFNSSFASARPTSTFDWFYNMQNLLSITGISNLNTSEVTNMSSMFWGCTKLTSLDVSGFNTAKVTDMSFMFYDCSSLRSLDLSSFNTAKVIYMSNMFNNCQALTSLDVSSFNTSNVTDMSYMFTNCRSLTSLDLNSFNTSKVTKMPSMFGLCWSLTSLNLSSFNTSNVTDMSYMFYNCDDLTTIYVSTRWSTAAVTNSSSMFYNCTKLKGGKGTTYNASHTDKAYAHIDGGSSNPGYFTARAEPYACYTPSNTTLTFYYDTQRSSRSGTTYDLNEGYNYPDWYNDGTNASVTKVVFNSSFASARPTSTFDWFYNMQNLLSITGISNLNTSEVTNMSSMFWGCTKLTSLDVSGFNTAKVTDMSFMFYDCSSLRSLDLSSFNTAKVIYMSNMFNNCQALTSLDVSSFNTSNVTDMSYMFTNCRNLTSLDVNSFNTSKVTQMTSMFANCWSLTSLNLSSFNTAKVTDMSYMFYDCCDLTTIHVGSEWSTVAVTSSSDMFWHCIRLVGGQGTTFDANHVDKAYAHIDGGPSNPGYMSQFMRGDVNHDGFVNVADVTALIQIILNSMPVDLAVADLSGDNNVNVADVTALIQIILNQ